MGGRLILGAIVDRFGFLDWGRAIEFKGGSIAPVPEFKETADLVASCTNQDGFLYPGMSQQVIVDLKTNQTLKEIARTRRPALLHRLPASHTLRLCDPGTTEELRQGSGAFVVHLLGYLFGTRLQFWDWWFDGRVPTRLWETHNITFSEATVQDFLSHSYKIWRAWNEKERRLLTNALYMHCRAPMYEWDWERFTIEYMVLDACLKLANLSRGVKDKASELAKKRYCGQLVKLRRGVKAKSTAEPIEILCCRFGIPIPPDDDPAKKIVEKIVLLRNELFHEALWDGSQPCMGVDSDTFFQPYNLRRLNQRLIPALLGYETPYIRTNWWSIGTFGFDPPSRHDSK